MKQGKDRPMAIATTSKMTLAEYLTNVRGLSLFKFTDVLQSRLEVLFDRQKVNFLTAVEIAELAGITELDRIFSLMNARIIAES